MKNARNQFKHYAEAYRNAKEEAEKARQEFNAICQEAKEKFDRFSPEHKDYIHAASNAWDQAEAKAEKALKLSNMARAAYTQDIANRIADAAERVLKKYEGKQAGEKTREKAFDEVLKEALTEEEYAEKRTYIYAESSFVGKESYALHISPSTNETVTLYPANGNNVIDENNKFVAATFSRKDVSLNVEKQLNQLDKQRQKVDAQINKLAEAIKTYNNIAGANANHIAMPFIPTRV